MSDRKSLALTVIRNMAEAPGTATAISNDLFQISRGAVGKIRPGATVKEQINAAWINLGRPPMWRLKSAWWKDGSHAWSAAAVRDFQDRYRAYLDREARRAIQAQAIEQATAAVREPDYVRLARAEYEDLKLRIAAIEKALRFRP